MLRYNANSRLFKYTTEEKKRYKLYKKKKMWVVAGMSLFSTATLVNANASADELSTTAVATDGTQKAATQSEEDRTNGETLKEEVTTENKASEKENDITENKVSEKETGAVEDKAAEQEEVHVEEKLTPDAASELTNSEVTTESKQDQAESVTKERPKAEPQTDRVEETKASATLAPKEAPLEATTENLTVPTSVTETSVSEKDAGKKEQTPQIQGQEVISDKAGVISNASDRLSRGGVFRRVGDQATKETISLLATPASVEPQADGASIERSIKVSSVTKGTQTGILSDPKKLADNSTEYTLTSDIFVGGEPKIGMTVTYTGKNGDTFSMRVVPGENTASDYYNNPGYEMRPSGNPIKEGKDGSYLFTWTITDAPENVSVARTQTIPAVPFFRENTSVEGNYKPYFSGSDSGILKPGASYSLKFFINGQAAPADTTVKFVADKILKIKRTEIDTDSDASSTFPIGKKTANKTTDTNYVYQVKVGLTPLVSGRSPYVKTAALNYSVPVPEHFLLDVDATTEYLNKTTHRNYSEAYRGGSVKVTQPGGEGTPILIETKGLLSASSYSGELYLDVPFVGRYTSTETNGRSDIISGWFDLGDGQKHYFGKVNIDTNEALNDPEYLKQSTGFRESILPKDATEVKNGITIPAVHENYYVRLWYSSDDQQYMITNHVSSDYSYVKREGSTHIPAEIKRRLPALEKGDPSAPLLYAVGLGANGLTEFKPTYHFDFPDEITSTGIVMPLNNVTNDYADYESYNPAQPGYTVVVTGNDGSKITQRLLAGESYNPITGSIDHFGTFSKGEKLAEGVKIAAYDVTPDKEYYASAYLDYYSVRKSNSLNDITTGYINILGYLNTKAQSDVEYISNVVVESANKYVPVQFKTKKIDELKLPVIVDGLPMSSNNGNQQTILNLNDTYSIQLRAYGVKYVGNARVNLDAGGALQGKPDQTATDLPGHALNIPFGTVKDPIVYLTVPNQMTIENISGTNQFYEVYGAEGSVPKPQITRKQNLDGQVVYILDWTGTGFELSSKMGIIFKMRVKKQGLNDFDPAQTRETLYAYEDVANKKTLDLYTEQQLKAKGVSIEGLKAYKPNVDSTNNTSWLQISGDLSETTLLESYKTKMTFADGTSADTMMLGSGSNGYYLRIIAPVEVRPAPLIKGTKDDELGITGVNYPTKDYYEVDGKKVGLQELQLGMVNNTADPLKDVISVMNLPQVGEKDGNDRSSNATEQGFTLNISEQGKLAFDPTNNNAKDAHTLYYSTSPVTLSSDGTTLRFANGTVWTRGQALPSELLTAQQVTDWSTIKALVMYIPSLSEGNQILYHFNAYSPTSEANMSKRVKLLQVGGYEKQASLVMGDVTDSYATYATLRIVDQAGNQINGYKEVRGQAILDPETHEYVVENKDLFGEAGKALVLDPPATITGYKFVQNNFSSTVLQADGSTVVTRSYQVDRARVLEGSLSGPVLAEATGDPQANTGNKFQADPTGVSEITFNLTDAQLARKGYKYKITVVDRNNKELVDKNGRTDYDTLAEALEAHGMFDNNNDRYGATQNFIVNYIGNFQKAVIISQNDPAKEIPMSVNEAGVVSPYYSDGQSGQVMFYDEDGAPLISDNTLLGNGTPAFKRQDYRYTVTAPDGTTYSSIDKAMAAKLKFDNTENDGEVDRDIQVYRIDYVKDLQNLRLTIIDDEGDLDGSGAKILVDNVELGSGLSKSVVDEETKTSYASWIKRYTDQGYVVVSQDELPTNYDNDPTVDQTVVVHLKHGTEEKAGSSKTLVQRINYVYESGVKKGEEAAPRYSKAFTFTSVDTIDKVTKKVIRTVWSPDQTAPVVVSPTIKGYDLSRSEIQQIVSVDSTDSELTHTVLYYPEIQTLNVKIIDDTLGETIIQGTLATGYTNAELPASVYQQYQNYIDAYTNAGYVLVSKDLLPANFDEDSTVDQEVVVHLNHGTKQEAGVDKTVTQTITYVYGNGPKTGQKAADDYTKAYVFTSVNTLDAVTGEVLKTTWSPAQETTAVTSPSVAGYVADKAKVASQSVSHDTSDLNEVVTYTAGDQTVKVHYIDVYGVEGDYSPTSGTELKERLQTLTGEAEASYTNTLWDYAQAGYQLVQAQPEATAGNFDTDPSTDQNYYVYLTHAMKQVAGKPVTITQMINYVYGNGPRTGQKAADSSSKAHTFTPTYTVDQVTKQNVGEPVWTPENAEFSAVVSPTIAGYTPDKGEIEAITITPSSENSEHIVYYNANQQKLTYTVIDDGDGNKVLVDQSQLATGDSDSVISASVLQAYQNIINGYQKQGYVLVSADSLPANFDNNDEVDQNVVIHLNHGTKQEAGVDKTVTQTITYVYGNGPKTGQKAADDYTKAYVFTSVNTLDAVTGEVLKTTWSPAQETTAVTSPSVAGYVADKAKVASQSVSHDTSDLNEVVTYTAGDQTVKVHYIDVYGVEGDYSPTSGTELKERLQTLTGEAEASYTNTLWDYAQAGYQLVQAQPEATAGNFDTDPSTDQNYYVYLTHAMKQVEGTPVKVSRTINYIYRTGSKAGQPVVPKDKIVKVFIPTYMIDQVTKQTVGTPTWSPDKIELEQVSSPSIAGYTPDKQFVEGAFITPTSDDIEETVYYDAEIQNVTYTIIDNTEDKVLVADEVLTRGESGTNLTVTSLQEYQQIIEAYRQKGYEIVKHDILPASFDSDSTVDQNVQIRVVHGMFTRAGADKQVTQTINYVYGNGPAKAMPAAPSYTKTYIFTSEETVDKVTGKVVRTVWSPVQSTSVVESPSITGYVADKSEVSAVQVKYDTADMEETISYYAGEQLVNIHYIDINGKDITTDILPSDGTEIAQFAQHLTGEAGADYTNQLSDYLVAGYELVYAQKEATAGTFDEDPGKGQDYYVYLKHGTETLVGTSVTIKDTINYIYGNGPHVGEPVVTASVITRTFIPTYTVDKVTGETIGTIWSGDGTIDPSVVPTIAGYTPDRLVIAGRVLTPDMQDQSQTVYYTMTEEPTTPDKVVERSARRTHVEKQAEKRSASFETGQKYDEMQIVSREVVEELPQTGDEKDKASLILGLGLLSGATLLGTTELGQKRRKKKRD